MLRPRRPWAPAVLAVATFGTATTQADQVSGSRSDELAESAHSVEAVIDRGQATLTVRRTVYNGGRRHDQATFYIDLPQSAVATGLRTLGTLGHACCEQEARWFWAEQDIGLLQRAIRVELSDPGLDAAQAVRLLLYRVGHLASAELQHRAQLARTGVLADDARDILQPETEFPQDEARGSAPEAVLAIQVHVDDR